MQAPPGVKSVPKPAKKAEAAPLTNGGDAPSKPPPSPPLDNALLPDVIA